MRSVHTRLIIQSTLNVWQHIWTEQQLNWHLMNRYSTWMNDTWRIQLRHQHLQLYCFNCYKTRWITYDIRGLYEHKHARVQDCRLKNKLCGLILSLKIADALLVREAFLVTSNLTLFFPYVILSNFTQICRLLRFYLPKCILCNYSCMN